MIRVGVATPGPETKKRDQILSCFAIGRSITADDLLNTSKLCLRLWQLTNSAEQIKKKN